MENFERRFLLHVPSSTENLSLIRDFVANIGKQAGLAETELSMVELAVDEACANVIEHAYGLDQTKEVIVRARLDGDAITIEVVDTGKGWDPGSIEQKELKRLVEERRSGGNRRKRRDSHFIPIVYAMLHCSTPTGGNDPGRQDVGMSGRRRAHRQDQGRR